MQYTNQYHNKTERVKVIPEIFKFSGQQFQFDGKWKLYTMEPPKNSGSEIGIDGELELLHEYFFEGGDVILLIKNEHGFFVIDGFHRSE